MRKRLKLDILQQPDDTTCGPTCLHAVYGFYHDAMPLKQVIQEVKPLDGGGTLAVYLACHALERGYSATIYTYNLHVFDPTWFSKGMAKDVSAKLAAQAEVKHDAKLRTASNAYQQFLKLGGSLHHEEMRPGLIRRYLARGLPILTGLSATYLYNCPRETSDNKYDAIRGVPAGHFVVLCGYNRKTRKVRVADPLHDNPRFRTHTYNVGIDRVIGAIMLGIVTYDANLLVLQPKGAR